MCSSSRGQKLYYTASGIITPVGGRPVHRPNSCHSERPNIHLHETMLLAKRTSAGSLRSTSTSWRHQFTKFSLASRFLSQSLWSTVDLNGCQTFQFCLMSCWCRKHDRLLRKSSQILSRRFLHPVTNFAQFFHQFLQTFYSFQNCFTPQNWGIWKISLQLYLACHTENSKPPEMSHNDLATSPLATWKHSGARVWCMTYLTGREVISDWRNLKQWPRIRLISEVKYLIWNSWSISCLYLSDSIGEYSDANEMHREYLLNEKERRYGTKFQKTTEVSRRYIFKTHELIKC